MDELAAVIVALAGTWLIGLAGAAAAKPDVIKRFFDKFASSAFTHFLEMFVRLVVGTAFVIYAPQMRFSVIFTAFGWLLIVTTAVLLLVPWRLHRRFAERSLPLVTTSRMILFSLVSFIGGMIVLISVILGSGPN